MVVTTLPYLLFHTTGVAVLHRSAKRLREQWSLAQAKWDDQTSREFEEQVLRPLVPQLNLTVAAVQRLAEVLERAEKDLDDRPAES